MEPLPAELMDGPFSTAAARKFGLGWAQLQGRGLVVVTHGARTHAQPEGLTDRAAAYLAAMHGEVALSHVTAAQLWGLPLPRALEAQLDLDVMCGPKAGPVRRAGCIGHRGLDRRETTSRSGLPVTSLADTWVDLGEVLKRGLDLDDLVVAGDVVARELDGARGDGGGVRQLRECLLARVRPRGKSRLAQALAEISPRSKSPMETRARLVFARGGLPMPELNVAVHFDRDEVGDGLGGWMLEADFVWRSKRIIGEYQGEHHATIRQRAIDAARRRSAEDEGWTFIEIFAGDVYTRTKRITMLRRLGDALGVPRTKLNLE